MMKSKRASARDIIFVAIILFVFGIAFFIVNSIWTTTSNQMINIGVINESNTTVQVLEGTQRAINRADYIMMGLFVGLVLALIITGWFIGGVPIFMFIYFIVVVITVVVSTVLSNVWESVTTISIFGATIGNFPVTNNLLLNLPIYMAVVGVIGLVVMFAKPYFQNE